jgi:hypothetical protein
MVSTAVEPQSTGVFGSGKFLQAIFDTIGAKAVAFVHAVRQIKIHLPAKRPQNFDEERGGGHAIHVIIAKDDQ